MNLSPDQPPDNVIAIRPDVEIQFTPKKAEWCKERCRRVIVVEESRQLQCEHCGRMIEAFDYVMAIACREINLIESEKDLKRQITEKRRELERLEQLVRNARSKARRSGVAENSVLAARYPWTDKTADQSPTP